MKPDYYQGNMPETYIYSGNADLKSVLLFVNKICKTDIAENSQLSQIGAMKDNILESMYRLNSASVFSTMNQIFHSSWNPFKHGILNHAKESVEKDAEFAFAQCEKIEIPNWETFFKDYFLKSKPVIFKNVTKKWPAFKKWSNDFLKQKFTKNKIHVKLAPYGIFEGCENITLWSNHDEFKFPAKVKSQLLYPDLVVVRPAPGSLHFGEFIDFMKSSAEDKKNVSAYIEYASIEEYMPGLSADIEEMAFLKGNFKDGHLNHKNVWLSDGNTLGKLHFDAFENFLCQISGKKQVTMFEPHDNRRLYEAHIQEAELSFDKKTMMFTRQNLLESTSMVMSPVDILNPDFKRFPLFADAVPLNCTISEGDVLYMPSYWWHEVQSSPSPTQHRNLAVNFWYDPFLTKEFPCPECPFTINDKYEYLLARHLHTSEETTADQNAPSRPQDEL